MMTRPINALFICAGKSNLKCGNFLKIIANYYNFIFIYIYLDLFKKKY